MSGDDLSPAPRELWSSRHVADGHAGLAGSAPAFALLTRPVPLPSVATVLTLCAFLLNFCRGQASGGRAPEPRTRVPDLAPPRPIGPLLSSFPPRVFLSRGGRRGPQLTPQQPSQRRSEDFPAHLARATPGHLASRVPTQSCPARGLRERPCPPVRRLTPGCAQRHRPWKLGTKLGTNGALGLDDGCRRTWIWEDRGRRPWACQCRENTPQIPSAGKPRVKLFIWSSPGQTSSVNLPGAETRASGPCLPTPRLGTRAATGLGVRWLPADQTYDSCVDAPRVWGKPPGPLPAATLSLRGAGKEVRAAHGCGNADDDR